MKRLKISALAVLAVLTIGLTAATRVDLLKETKPVSTYTCRVNTDIIKADFIRVRDGNIFNDYFNDDFTVPSGVTNLCPGELAAPGDIHYCAKDVVLATSGEESEDYTCTAGTDEFCCAEVVANTSPANLPCNTSGTPDLTGYTYKVKVWCKIAD